MEPSSPLQPNDSPAPAARTIDDIQPPRPFSMNTQPVSPSLQPSAQTTPTDQPFYQEPQPVSAVPTQATNAQNFFQPSVQAPVQAVSYQPATSVIPQTPQATPQDQGSVQQVPLSPLMPPASSFDKVSIPQPTEMKKRNNTGLVKRLLIVLVGLLLLGGIGFGAYYFISHIKTGPAKLSTADLKTSQQNGFSYSVPKNWVNATSKLSDIQNSLSSSNSISNVAIYADGIHEISSGKYSPNYAYLATGSSDMGTTLSASDIENNPTLKQTFQQTFNDQFNSDSIKSYAGTTCANVSNYSSNITFSTSSNFQILIVVSGDCILGASDAKSMGISQIHLALEVGFTQNNMYLFALSAAQQSWTLNQNVYTTMLSSFKAN